MSRISLLFLIAISLFSCNTNMDGKKEVNEDDFNSANEQVQGFKYNKNHINPLVVYSFFPWESDRFQYWQEIDLTASDDANRFYIDREIEIEQEEINNFMRITYRPNDSHEPTCDFNLFSYTYLGRLNNGVEVLEYAESGKGSANYNGLIGFTFSKRKVSEDTINHIFMREEKSYSLQQYCKFELDKENNRVLVRPIDNMPQADFYDMPKIPFYVNFPKEATEALMESLKD